AWLQVTLNPRGRYAQVQICNTTFFSNHLRFSPSFPARHSSRVPLMSFGMTGAIRTWTSHSCPFWGCTGIYCTASCNLTGSRPSFTTLPTPTPMGTVQTFPDDAFQFARILPEYPILQPSPKKRFAKGWRLSWLVSGRAGAPPMENHCCGNTPRMNSFVR